MFFFWKKRPLPIFPKPIHPIPVEQRGKLESISVADFELLTKTQFIPQLVFDARTHQDIVIRTDKLAQRGELTSEQRWRGAYFKQEILAPFFPDVFLRYIDPSIGWGVFAARDFKKMEFIAEYGGLLRRRRRSDRKNGYCFEYILSPGERTPYTIDAQEQGGIARYINHSFTPNLESALATVDRVGHIILCTKRAISKGEQLCYDYGEDYWKHRPPPAF